MGKEQTKQLSESMLTRPFSITGVHKESYDTFTLEMESLNGDEEFSFEPGQFNMLYLYGIGEVPISIAGDPLNPKTLVHTTRAVGTVTKAMRVLRAGDVMGIRGPYGNSWPVEEARGYDVVFVAGGIGLAPLRPALFHVISHRDEYGKVVLLYGTRSPEDILFRKDLERWRSRFDLDVYITVDYGDTKWRGNVGLVTTLISKAPFDPKHTISMVCGPEIMMHFTAVELLKRGVEEEYIYFTMERNMKCAIGFCGHCQFGSHFICKDGPVFQYPLIKDLLSYSEV